MFLLIILCCLVGCPATTAINSDPQGANVFLDGEFEGVTPLPVRLSDWSNETTIKCEKVGYKSQERLIMKRVSTTHGVTYGTASVYNYKTNSMGTAWGMQNTMQTTSEWPTDVFFKLEKGEDEKE